MSQVIADEQLRYDTVVQPIQKWTTARSMLHLYPGQNIKDDRLPALLCQQKQPTFITIDHDFWNSRLCDSHYCIVYFALDDAQQELVPDLLRRLFKHPDFNTRAKRMGKVIRISTTGIQFYQLEGSLIHIASMKRNARLSEPSARAGSPRK